MAYFENINGEQVSFEAAVNLMDDELREQVHEELAPCTEQEFVERYAELHEERYCEGFAPYTGEAW